MKREKSDYIIQSVENALDVLEQFKGLKGNLGISELSTTLGLHKNNIFRLLATMESYGYIDQDLNTEEYRLGIKCLELGRAYLNNNGLIKVAHHHLSSMRDEVNENIYLGLLRNNEVIYVDHAESNQILRVSSRIGNRMSPLCTAIGKVLLAYSSKEEAQKIIDANKFVKHTENTIMDKDSFIKELETVKSQAYSVDNQELDQGVICVAAPILDYERKAVGGISVSGPSLRMSDDRLENIYVPKIKETALKISKAIGFVE